MCCPRENSRSSECVEGYYRVASATPLFCGGGVPKFEPKIRLPFGKLDKSIQELRAMHKAHPEWFEVPKPKSTKGKNEVNYSI